MLLVFMMLFTMMPGRAWAEEAEPVIPTDTKLISLQVAVGGATADSITEKTLKEVFDPVTLAYSID